MNPWTALVGALQGAIEAVGQAMGGSLGAGILVVTLVLRLLLIPILLPLAARSRDRSRVFERMKPELRALKEKHRKEPDQLDREIAALHRRHGIRLVDTAGLWLALIQLPVLIAMFQAVLHISEGTRLGENGWLPGLLAAAASMASLKLGGQSPKPALLAMAGMLPVAISAWLGTGVALYLVAFYAGSALQAILMRRMPVQTPETVTDAGA
ncbi:MAG: YidC/Oxa1 family membrane protein insertase [Longimicrobiales bacterium]